jgi:pre-rRNA-processing protein TSR3
LDEYGHRLLGKFKWGHAFYTLNEELFDIYKKCVDANEIIEKQNSYLKDMNQAYIDAREKPNEDLLSVNPNHIASSDNDSDFVSNDDDQQLDSFGNTIEYFAEKKVDRFGNTIVSSDNDSDFVSNDDDQQLDSFGNTIEYFAEKKVDRFGNTIVSSDNDSDFVSNDDHQQLDSFGNTIEYFGEKKVDRFGNTIDGSIANTSNRFGEIGIESDDGQTEP